MGMAEWAIIFNPAAHSDRAAGFLAALQALPGPKRLWITEGPGDATAQTQRALASGCRGVVAAGGDGTVNEVVRALRSSGKPLGILPLGTVNVLAMELGLPLHSLEQCWDLILRGQTRPWDLGLAKTSNREIPFVQLAGAGLDAAVVMATTTASKKIFGPLSYVLSLASLSTGELPKVTACLDNGEELAGELVLVGNGRFYGGPMAFFPHAKPDDGLLDVAVFERGTPWDLIRYFQGVLFGQHTDLPDVAYRQTHKVCLQASSEAALEIDGEPGGALPVEISVEPAALKVISPSGE